MTNNYSARQNDQKGIKVSLHKQDFIWVDNERYDRENFDWSSYTLLTEKQAIAQLGSVDEYLDREPSQSHKNSTAFFFCSQYAEICLISTGNEFEDIRSIYQNKFTKINLPK